MTLIKHTTTLAPTTRYRHSPHFRCVWWPATVHLKLCIHCFYCCYSHLISWSWQLWTALTDHSTVSTSGLLWEHLVSLAHWDPASIHVSTFTENTENPPDLDGINPDMHRCCHQGCALQVAANDSEVSGTCVTWCEKLPSWGSMILLFGTEILSTQLQPSYFYLQGCPNFARNPASPPQGMQPSQPLAITREHSDRSQRGYANLKRATPRDQMISDSFRKATPLKRTEFHAQDCWVGAFQFFLEAKLVCKNQSGTITRLINGQ